MSATLVSPGGRGVLANLSVQVKIGIIVAVGIAVSLVIGFLARISDFQTTIASAVEEQTATTAEMNRSVSEAANGSEEVARNITGVASATQQTTDGVRQSQEATAELARMAAELTSLVSAFRY